MSESEQDTRANIRMCREEKPAQCELCLWEYFTESLAVYLCVQCCIYYCDKHRHVHSSLLARKEKHTEIALNETKEMRNRNFKLYLEELKGDNLDFEFDERKISLSGFIDVRDKFNDMNVCCITGIVLLNDGRLSLLDQNNYCIKFLDLRSQMITSYIHIPFQPSYLSEYEIGKGVVTCPYKQALILIDLNTCAIISMIQLKGVCRCVGSLRDMFIVSFTDTGNMPLRIRAHIQIMNRDGKVLKVLPSLRNDTVFIDQYYLVVDKDREVFYVQDFFESAVMCFDLTGTMLNSYKHEKLKHQQAMTIGPDGDVYVAGMRSLKVHKLSPLLKESQSIVDKSDLLDAMCFINLAMCTSSNTLYVSHPNLSPAGDYIRFYKEE